VKEADMTDRDFLKMFSGLIAALVALTVIIFILAQMVVSGTSIKPGKSVSAENTSATVPNDDAVAARIKPVGEVSLSGNGVMNSLIPAANAAGADPGKATYESTCVACHGAGVAGAPVFGNKTAWAPHIAKGIPTLQEHAIKGFQGRAGFMPAKGGNASLSDADVKAAVEYMVSHGK